MRHLPRERVRRGVRNEWLLVAGVDRWAATRGEIDVLDTLHALNASLPCAPLPDRELSKMAPGVRKWGAARLRWLGRGLRAVAPSREAQRRRGVKSGRMRQRAALRRDQRISRMVAGGKTNREIADAEGVTVRTVQRVCRRLRAAGRQERACG